MDGFKRELDLLRNRVKQLQAQLVKLEHSLERLYEEKIREVWLHSHDMDHDKKKVKKEVKRENA